MEPLFTKHGRAIIFFFAIGFLILLWGRISGISNTGLGALFIIFLISLVNGIARFVCVLLAARPTNYEWPEQQSPSRAQPVFRPSLIDYEVPRRLPTPNA